jgi:hypothetical protein
MGGNLKPLDVEREEKPGKYADGDGLYLIVASKTSKNWSYRYWFKGKNVDLVRSELAATLKPQPDYIIRA